MRNRPLLARSGSGERHSMPGFDVEFEIPGEATDGVFAIVEFTLAPHRLIPPHTHVADDELSYVLEGDVGYRVGGETFTATPGTYVQKPRGIPHTFWNPTDRPVRIMELLLPGSAADSFRGLASPGRIPNIHSDEWVPDLVARYGLTLIGT
ncbi:MAG: cupin domain-containing protein [Chloroflexota bacterium]|nr:cupin domain-containing protein [Chloroflexota bacterium]